MSICISIEKPKVLKIQVKDLLWNELIGSNPLPFSTKVDAVYILGGSQKSLVLKYKTAAKLYHEGICRNILILGRPGKTEYNRALGRNLTNNEWSILALQKFGVPAKHIEPIKIHEGFFGTLSEAKSISKLIKKRQYKSILLISSPHHTKRVSISFAKYLKDYNITVFTQYSEDKEPVKGLLIEYLKLKIYEYFLL